MDKTKSYPKPNRAISPVGTILGKYNTYVGARYVPIFFEDENGSNQWRNDVEYEPLVIVEYQGGSYTSKTFVPIGVDILNTKYWIMTGNYNAQVEAYRRETAELRSEVGEFQDGLEAVGVRVDGVNTRIDGVEEDTDNKLAALDAKTVKYVDEISSELLRSGVLPETARLIHVGSDPAFDFDNPISAVNSIVDGQATIIFMHEGVYHTEQLTGVGDGWGLTLPNNTYMVGVGYVKNIQLWCTTPTPQNLIATLNLTYNSGVYNMFLVGQNCRYVVHDDFHSETSSQNGERRVVKDCEMTGLSLYGGWVYGAGIKGNQTLVFENNYLVSDTEGTPFSMHNWTNVNSTSEIYIKNCRFETPIGKYGGIRLGCLTDYAGSSKWKPVNVYIDNCLNDAILVQQEAGNITDIPFKIYHSGVPCIDYNVVVKPDLTNDIHAPNSIQVLKCFNDSIGIRSAVFRGSTFSECAKWAGSLSYQMIIGVALNDATKGRNMAIMTKGYVRGGDLGLSGDPGQVVFVGDTGTIGLSSVPQPGRVLGYVTAMVGTDNRQLIYIDTSFLGDKSVAVVNMQDPMEPIPEEVT